MSLIEFIGFVISFIAMLVLFFRRRIELNQQKKNPELYEEMQRRREVRMKEFLNALDVQEDRTSHEEEEEDDEEEYEPQPIPKRQPPKAIVPYISPQPVRENYQFRTAIEQYKHQTAIEKRQLPTSLGESYKNRFDKQIDEDIHRDIHADAYSYDDAYSLVRKKEQNRIVHIIGQLNSPKDMVLLQEVIGPPKALRNEQTSLR